MKYDKAKFRFIELFTNTDGKTSSSGFAGVAGFFVGLISFISAVIAYYLQLPGANELMNNIILLLTISAGLLGVRKIWGAKEHPKEEGMDV